MLMTQTPPLNLTLDPISFARDTQRARQAVDQFKAELRPVCPACKKMCAVVGTRIDESERIRYIGCRTCGYREETPEIVPLTSAPTQTGPGRPRNIDRMIGKQSPPSQ